MAGGGEVAIPSSFFEIVGFSQGHLAEGAGGARFALHTEFLPSLLSSEGAFSGISDSLLQKNFSGSKPPDPQTTIQSLGY